MKVVVAIDSFKGSLGSREAGEAARAGVLSADPSAEVHVVQVADGGEGTLSALLAAREGRRVPVEGCDALGRPCTAEYLVLDDGTAVIESAVTVGLTTLDAVTTHVPPRASSYGLGLQLRHALASGAPRVLVGLGGTATTDGGTGMLMALGAVLRDDEHRRITPADGNPLWRFAGLDAGTLPRLGATELVALSDVTSPLLGPEGAASVFGPQKGADPAQVAHLEERMGRWAAALAHASGPVAHVPGAGAAGGIAAALLALGGRVESGFARLAAEAGLPALLDGADLVLTGEGRIDAQTAHGKVPAAVGALGRRAGAVVVALAGSVARGGPDATADVDAAFPVHSGPRTLAEAMDPRVTAEEITATSREVTRLLMAARRGAAAG